MAEESKPNTDEGPKKPPGHALLEKMLNHHKEMLDGVAADMPMIELPDMKNGIKKCMGTMHKEMCSLMGTHGKAYGLKLKDSDMPEELTQEREPNERAEADDSEQEVQDKDLPEDEAGMEDDLTEEDEKAFVAQIKAMEAQANQQDEFLAAVGLKD